ncbi:MAG: hypothetical protein D6788_07490 [Planctomycetota bacterium]|nr:MAG: hypothetical protein D6788_07490 [Planctomycetota bacterium]
MMDFLKRHLFYIVSALVGIVGVVLIFTGIQRMPRVVDQMKQVQGMYASLSGLQSQPVNQAKIDALERRIKKIRDDYRKVIEKAKSLEKRELLVPGVLPNGDALQRIEFRKKYHEAMTKLLDSLHGGGTANAVDVARAKELVQRELADEAEAQRDPTYVVANPIPPGPERTPAGVLTEAGVHRNPVARAHIAAALRILMYVTHWKDEKPPAPVSSLDYYDKLRDLSAAEPPELWDVWHAQMGYWIQKDVVEAIASINEEAAARLRKQGQHPWVGNMPIKELISIRVSEGLIPPGGEAVAAPRAGGYEEALPPGSAAAVFTGHGSGDLYDVMQFTVKLIMDERDIPLLLERLSANRFHIPLRVAYVEVPPNRTMVGKIYGPEPVVNVIMDFETIFLGEVYRRYMPSDVIDSYEVVCRPEDHCPEDGG